MSHSSGHGNEEHKHHILSDGLGFKILFALLIGTVITVAASRVQLGPLNFPVAMLIATGKAILVVLFFMGLKYDTNENRTIFLTSFVFFAIFIVLTASDRFFRGDVVAKPGFLKAPVGESKYKNPWNSTPEMMTHGKAVYSQQCASCHGDAGQGNGPAAAALDPKPRNFTGSDGWLNGRETVKVFGTISKGVKQMPSFGTLPTDDRWAVTHYVLSFGKAVAAVSDSDLKAAGIDPAGSGSGGQKSIPIDLAIDQLSQGK